MTNTEGDCRILLASTDPLSVDTIAPYQIEALRSVAFATPDEDLADACTVALSCVGQTESERMAAVKICVDAINEMRAEAQS